MNAPLVQVVDTPIEHLRGGDRFVDPLSGELYEAGPWLHEHRLSLRRARSLRTGEERYVARGERVLAASILAKRAKAGR